MSNINNRDGIIELDDAQLNSLGRSIVGGNFTEDFLSGAAAGLFGTIVAACWYLTNPANRRDAWKILMSNFSRSTISIIVSAGVDADSTSPQQAAELQAVDTILEKTTYTDPQAFEVVLNIVDDE